jgi:hypothetical protein
MKKLMLGFALTLFLGTYTVSANNDNPPKEKAKTESKSEKKECTAEKKSCCKDKATAGTDAKCTKKSSETASTK